jgi:hypothetical protein
MKLIALLSLATSLSVSATTVTLPEYGHELRDVRTRNETPESLFKKLNRTLVRVKDSICSNRAHVWAYDFEKRGLDGAKVFLFFTPKTSTFDGNTWWYHVAPVVNDGGKLWVLDGGFPHRFDRPLALSDWLREFNGEHSVCKEIKREDEVLVKLMFGDHSFPETTVHGKYNCYYRLTPPGYWIPSQVAANLTGTDEAGRPVRVERDAFDLGEVFQACRETSTGVTSYVLRRNVARCNWFLEHGPQNLISVY